MQVLVRANRECSLMLAITYRSRLALIPPADLDINSHLMELAIRHSKHHHTHSNQFSHRPSSSKCTHLSISHPGVTRPMLMVLVKWLLSGLCLHRWEASPSLIMAIARRRRRLSRINNPTGHLNMAHQTLTRCRCHPTDETTMLRTPVYRRRLRLVARPLVLRDITL